MEILVGKAAELVSVPVSYLTYRLRAVSCIQRICRAHVRGRIGLAGAVHEA